MKKKWVYPEDSEALVVTTAEMVTIELSLKNRRDTLKKWLSEVNYGSDYQIQFRDDLKEVEALIEVITFKK